jgi:hypothetical protein
MPDTEARDRLVLVKRGQLFGFGALVLMLATIVTLAAIGQSWVAGIVATTGLGGVVAIFVTDRHQPAPVHIAEFPPCQPDQRPQRESPGSLPLCQSPKAE